MTVVPKSSEDVSAPSLGHSVNSGITTVPAGSLDPATGDEHNYLSSRIGVKVSGVIVADHCYNDTGYSWESSV